MASNVAHGKCLCGAVEIKAEGESMTTVACSCTNCQTCGGTTYTVNLVYPKDTVTVTSGMEDIREYEGVYTVTPTRYHPPVDLLVHNDRPIEFPLAPLSSPLF